MNTEHSSETEEKQTNDSLSTYYSIPEAAALWCGVSRDMLAGVLSECVPVSPGTLAGGAWYHPYIPGIEACSEAIGEAVRKGKLPSIDLDVERVPNGFPHPESPHPMGLAFEYRMIEGHDLKKWIQEAFPKEKPIFLFTLEEQSNTRGLIISQFNLAKHESRMLMPELYAKPEFAKLTSENSILKNRVDHLTQLLIAGPPEEPGKPLTPRSESTYQRIIAALLAYINGDHPGVDAHPSFENQSKLIDLIASHYQGYGGLSVRNLEKKFSDAKKSLDVT